MGRRENLLRELDNVSASTREVALPLIDDIVFMEERLASARRLINEAPIIIKYNNGGGQEGIRRNPAYEGYCSLLRAYISAVDEMLRVLGDKEDAEVGSLVDSFKVVRGNLAVGE